jgi:hypothetical protein
LPLAVELPVVPPSLPTGTVSRPSTGTRTFPPDSASESESTSGADGVRVTDGSTGAATSQVAPPSTTPRPDLPSAGVVSRREHDVALARVRERVAELEQENDVLRDYIETQAAERRAVIERYERLLDRQHATGRGGPDSTSRPAEASPATAGVLDSVRAAVRRLHARLVSVGRD